MSRGAQFLSLVLVDHRYDVEALRLIGCYGCLASLELLDRLLQTWQRQHVLPSFASLKSVASLQRARSGTHDLG